MCNRYTLKSLDALNSFPGELVEGLIEPWQPRYNIALTSLVPVITQRTKPTLETMQFGFNLPTQAADEKTKLLSNARAETALDKPTFRDATRQRRCLVPVDGFYEWEKAGASRLPHYFTLKSGAPFFFAGLWTPAHENGPAAFCIVTTAANALLQPIYHRIPVILGPSSGPLWLGDQPIDRSLFTRLCRPLPAEMMTGHRVDPKVNNVRYEAPDCIAAFAANPQSDPELY